MTFAVLKVSLMQPAQRYISNLTPLRGLAALGVVVFHFSETIAKFVSTDRTLILSKIYILVDLFFIMSGFIICHVYQKYFESGIPGQSFKRFIVARFARVYPLHLFTLVLLILLIAPGGQWNPVMSPKAIPTNILLLHSFGVHNIFTWNVPSWSISAEWWAYMAFPCIVLFISKKKSLALFVLTVFVILAYLGLMFWIPRTNVFDPSVPHRQNLDVTFDWGWLRGLAGFVTGILVYHAYHAGLFYKIFRKDLTTVLLSAASLYCLHKGLNDGITIVLFTMLVYNFALNKDRLHRVCNNGILQYIGKISYSIYLMQFFPVIPLFITQAKLPGLVYSNPQETATTSFWIGAGYCSVYVLLVIGIASLTYYTVEKPCRKLINRKWGKEAMPVYA